MLHLVNKAGEDGRILSQCIDLLRPQSAVLLIGDGVYAALDTPANRELIGAIEAGGCPCFALREDIEARAVTERVLAAVEMIDYARFVALALEYDKVQSWG